MRSGRDFRVGDVLKMWMWFYTQGKFSWRKKSLCTGMGGGEGEIIVHNAAMNQNPKPKLVLLLPCCCSITFFTSTSNINYFFIIFYARTLFQTIFEN